ncbi:MAG: flagellar motor switch protein FliN [Calditerrivibrio sp.]|nr:flagellar motor switch protein FliN [Calditerrivibrio sp.]MCA1980426.1 flagellar motor switch protein FliN [Calditerrivibrio sp.]
MLKKLDLNSELKEFSNLLAGSFGNSFSSLLGKNYEFTITDVNEGELNDIALEFMGQTMVVLKETIGDIFGGLLAQTQTITAFADLMLMGSGEGVAELNDDLKDAIKELINQTISSINTPFYEKFGKKVSFAAMSVDHLMDTSSYPGEIIVFDLKSSSGESLKLYFGKKLKSLISADEENDDFDFSPEVTALNEMPKVQKSQGGSKNIDLLLDVEVPVSIRIGSTRMFLKDIASLSPGNIVELDEYAEEPVVVLVNNKPIAKGEVVIVDGYFGVRIKEIISKEERIKKLRD